MASAGSGTALNLAGSKLYYTPTSCSFSVFATALQVGAKGIALEQVDLHTHKTSSGGDYYKVNPKGNVPALILSDGTILNESAALLQLFADQQPSSQLNFAPGSLERYKFLSTLNFLASEIHPGLGAIFGINEHNKEFITNRANMKMKILDGLVAGKQYIVNDRLSVADNYAYLLLTWLKFFEMKGTYDSKAFTNALKYRDHIGSLPHIKAAHELAAKNPASL